MHQSDRLRTRAKSDSGSSRSSSPAYGRPKLVRSLSPTSDDDTAIPTESIIEDTNRPILRRPIISTAFTWKDSQEIPTYDEPRNTPATSTFLPGQGIQVATEASPQAVVAQKRKTSRKPRTTGRTGRPRTTRSKDPFVQHCFKLSDPSQSTQRTGVTMEKNTTRRIVPYGSTSVGYATQQQMQHSTTFATPSSLHTTSSGETTSESSGSDDSPPSSTTVLPRELSQGSLVPRPGQTQSATFPHSMPQPLQWLTQQPIRPTATHLSSQAGPGSQHYYVFSQHTSTPPQAQPENSSATSFQPSSRNPAPAAHYQNANGRRYNPTHYRRDYEDDTNNLNHPNRQYKPSSQSADQSSEESSSDSCDDQVSLARPQVRHVKAPLAKLQHPPAQQVPTRGSRPALSAHNDGSSLRLVTLLITDLRSVDEDEDVQLVEVTIPIKQMQDREGFWAKAQDLCQQLQAGAARIDGPSKLYAKRGNFKQILLRVSEDARDTFQPATVAISPTRTIELFVEDAVRLKSKPKSSHIGKRPRLSDSSSDEKSPETLSSSEKHPKKKIATESSMSIPGSSLSPKAANLPAIEDTIPHELVYNALQSVLCQTAIYATLSWEHPFQDTFREVVERCKFVGKAIKAWCGGQGPHVLPGISQRCVVTKNHVYSALQLEEEWIAYFEKVWPLYEAEVAAGSCLNDIDPSQFADKTPMDKFTSILLEAEKRRHL